MEKKVLSALKGGSGRNGCAMVKQVRFADALDSTQAADKAHANVKSAVEPKKVKEKMDVTLSAVSHVAGALNYYAACVAGEQVEMLVDTGASHCFASARVISAMQLPVADIAPVHVKLPNGMSMKCSKRCVVPVWFSATVGIDVKFLVVPIELPFVLGSTFLHQQHAKLNFADNSMELYDERGKSLVKLFGTERQNRGYSADVQSMLMYLEKMELPEVHTCSV